MSRMAAKGFAVNFGKTECEIQNTAGSVIAIGEKFGNLY